MNCRFDNSPLNHVFIDLGYAPPSNSYLTKEQLDEPEIYYPLKLYVSETAFLVQLSEYKKATEIFSDNYAYFSSYSNSWLKHCEKYAKSVMERFSLNKESLIIEVASNDGYLLQFFLQAGIPVLGIEPSTSVAKAAQKKGIRTLIKFFCEDLGRELSREGQQADLLIGNNVLAHVPDINDFVAGLKLALKKKGIITLEFPHLMQLVQNNQFDTIYHEHYSYFSFSSVSKIFKKHGLEIFDVEEISTHGGSLRIYAKHFDDHTKLVSKEVDRLLKKEEASGLLGMEYYRGFQKKVDLIKRQFLAFLLEKKSEGNTIAAYGAAAKGNTLLNYCGIRKDMIDFVVDASPYKQGRFLPGSHVPIVNESFIKEKKPDYIIIFPWNIKDEIICQLDYVRQWGAKFVVAIPELQIL